MLVNVYLLISYFSVAGLFCEAALQQRQFVRRFHRAVIIAREEMVLFGFVALIVLYLAAVGIYYFENEAWATPTRESSLGVNCGSQGFRPDSH